ncbi:Uncharacterised protein [Mycobacterium tuberculosis]|nr:Uncharacterised protein [Mycobacterium tuberculosis]
MATRGIIILQGHLNVISAANSNRLVAQLHHRASLRTGSNNKLRRASRRRRNMSSLRNRINRCRTIVLTQTKVTASRRNHQENKEPNQSQKSVTKDSNGQFRRH